MEDSEQIKIGDKVVCVDNLGWTDVLTVNKEYEVLDIEYVSSIFGENEIGILDDGDISSFYFESRFRKISKS